MRAGSVHLELCVSQYLLSCWLGCDSAEGLLDLVEVHLQRIALTVLYANAQDTNRSTSEATALFIGGS